MPQEIATILVQILPLVLIFVVFYFLLIRPQRKKDKEVKNMLANLKVGDRITTIGGFYATIAAIKDDVITISFGRRRAERPHLTRTRSRIGINGPLPAYSPNKRLAGEVLLL